VSEGWASEGGRESGQGQWFMGPQPPQWLVACDGAPRRKVSVGRSLRFSAFLSVQPMLITGP
jgi:hypothetical protein